MKCAGCRWWDSKPVAGFAGYGACRRHAPAPHHIYLFNDDAATNDDVTDEERRQRHMWLWPITLYGDWCGDYEERPCP